MALVTGGSRGIGKATSVLLGRAGFDVCINYRRGHDTAAEALRAVEADGGRGWLFQADVSQESEVLSMFEAIDARDGPLRALVNNAGVLDSQTSLTGITVERINRVFATNVVGAMVCAREAVRRMSGRFGGAGGAIVNVSSVASRYGAPHEYVDYAASKGAIDTFTLGLAVEEAPHGIRVNAVRPGIIDTDIHADGGEPGRVERLSRSLPMQRGGTAEEVAAAIVWLLSDEASYVNGTLLDVAGAR
ncbi:MAG: SDR family NAD(P)-dependent oxidoreductase [Proteobacteria bacterium]|nr:MAG: SDR family NAD(P)-dependent oxidoreductase [Pseudomonadota bacterium]